ncbi:twin-arginine translocase TatA/TatE family subunit [Lichenicoccus roseus]|uniref:Sec-independent protein translocase protein TatA n=1 Tax=Lichenicoccus roseus TaxID=2683649 RepID=A0A5R9JC38_9PROT|nr:twin-arginine translocase TatA/TatE family subunit [Lichenicoccus roseus]
MGGLSIWHWLIVLAVVLLLFGGSSKVSTLMGDFAKGIKSFKKNMNDDESMEAQGQTHPVQPNSIASPGITQTSLHTPPPVGASQEPVRHN